MNIVKSTIGRFANPQATQAAVAALNAHFQSAPLPSLTGTKERVPVNVDWAKKNIFHNGLANVDDTRRPKGGKKISAERRARQLARSETPKGNTKK